MNKKQARLIFEKLSITNPNPKTELEYDGVFELLIAVILSAQATDLSVNKSTKKLFIEANTPEGVLALGLDKLKEYIKNIGLYNNKALNIIKTCQILVEKFESQVPFDRKSLESLPGVGRKTANVVLNTAFNLPTIAVDTHVFRVANRTGLAIGKTPLEVERGLLQIIDKKYLANAHHFLVLHGRYICTAKKPKCSICPINNLCDFYKNSQ
jgi:endonuclease-3